MKKLNYFFSFLCILLWFNIQSQTIRYVKATGSPTGTGASWATASNDLQAMINVSSSGDIVKVAAGTYKPNRTAVSPAQVYTGSDSETKRRRTFLLKSGVNIIGGYPANITNTAAEKYAPITNKTILSGDFDSNDVFSSNVTISGNSENAYNVVTIAGNPNEAYLFKGFHITGGNANGTSTITVNTVAGVSLAQGGGRKKLAKS